MSTETQSAPAAPEIVTNINIAGSEFALIAHEVKERKTKTGTKPAHVVFVPQVTSVAVAVALVTSMIEAAEASNPGKGGIALASELYFDRAKDATAAAHDESSGAFTTEKYVAELTNTKVQRGDTIKALTEQVNALTHEQLEYMRILLDIQSHLVNDPNYQPDFGAINAKLGTKYSDIEQLGLRMHDLDARVSDLNARIAKKEASAEKAKKTKEAKASASQG